MKEPRTEAAEAVRASRIALTVIEPCQAANVTDDETDGACKLCSRRCSTECAMRCPREASPGARGTTLESGLEATSAA
jgi:hypothetical protein